MLELLLSDKALLSSFSHNIIKAHKIGIYDGAYKVVKLAMMKNKESVSIII